MKPYRALLVLLLAALAGAAGWQLLAEDPGYLLLTFRGWSVETNLVVAVLGLLLAGALLYLLVGLLRMPWRLWRRRRRRAARERFAAGLLALQSGEWLQAERLLRRAARDRDLRLPALLYASRAACERGARPQAEALLAEAARASSRAAAIPTLEQLLADGRAAVACELIDGLQQQGPLPPRVLELRARALAACGRHDEAVAMLPELQRARVRDGEPLQALQAELLQGWLRAADNSAELQRRWRSLDRAQRLMPSVVDAFAERARRYGDDEASLAAAAIERALAKGQWSDSLAERYGSLPHADHGAALRVAEGWLQQRPDNPSVLLCLGRLCRQDQLWGKAEAYLGRAIATGAGAAAWEALGDTYADQGDDPRGRQAYANALQSLRGDRVRPVLRLQRNGEEPAVAEERSNMGLPRLPAA
jgi:HemY protein